VLLDADHPDTLYFTRADFRLWCQRFGLGLQRSKHLKKGGRVLFSGNDGTLCGGGIFTEANPTYVARELAYQLKDTGATYLLCADASLDTGIEAAGMIGMSLDSLRLQPCQL
jgi:4-coumarate--CoA ligase